MKNEMEAISRAVILAYECYDRDTFKHAANIYKRCFPKYDAYTAIIALLSNHRRILGQKEQIVDIVGEEGYNLIDGLIYCCEYEAYDDFGVTKYKTRTRKDLNSYYYGCYPYEKYIRAIANSGNEIAIHVMQEKLLYCWQNDVWCGVGTDSFSSLSGRETMCHRCLEILFPDGKY